MKSIQVEFDQSKGRVKPLHGVNNGPITFGSLLDVSEYFEEISVPYVRIHDSNFPHPREVDIPQIFKNWEADPEDPASYDFEQTDRYLQSILATGAQIVYRLGVTIEHTAKKNYTHPPKDFSKWAQICVGIIRHYNHGWADGFHYGIKYWEIWNEPDGHSQTMWSGTQQEYLELYACTASAIKKFDPEIRIGGPAISTPLGDYLRIFIEFCRERQLPLDFVSWHTYGPEPKVFIENARLVRKLLDENGFVATESHLNEWNLWTSKTCKLGGRGEHRAWREIFLQQRNEMGASLAATLLISMQDEAVDLMNYYDTQPHNWFCGLFDLFGVPQKTFYAFKAFRTLLDYPERLGVVVSSDLPHIVCLPCREPDSQNAAILIARFGGEESACRLQLAASSSYQIASVHLIDKNHEMELVTDRFEFSQSEQGQFLDLELAEHSVILMRLEPMKAL